MKKRGRTLKIESDEEYEKRQKEKKEKEEKEEQERQNVYNKYKEKIKFDSQDEEWRIPDYPLNNERIYSYIEKDKKRKNIMFSDVDVKKGDVYDFIEYCKQAVEELKNNTNDISRKVIICGNSGHMSCACIFLDPQKNKISIITELYDGYKIIPDQGNIEIKNLKVDLQSDFESCGVFAIEMAKYLTTDWYKKQRHVLFSIEPDKFERSIIPTESLPEKLQSYVQQDVYKLSQNKKLYNDLIDKGYIIDKTHHRNIHPQKKKARILFYNRYQNEKAKINAKHDSMEYRKQKNEIIKNLFTKIYKNGITEDSESCKNERDDIDIDVVLNDKYSLTNGWNGENDKNVVSTLEKIELEEKKKNKNEIKTDTNFDLKDQDKNQNQINEIK